MARRIIITGDGSHSIETSDGVTYHSTFGAIQESKHIFIDAGLGAVDTALTVFEMGFGTGLNALLTFIESRQPVFYEAIESDPLSSGEAQALNYCALLGRPDLEPFFARLHSADWGVPVEIAPGFVLHKVRADGQVYTPQCEPSLIYWDAFDPVAQPGLWTEQVFGRVFACARAGAVLVTYCCKGAVRRALTAVGFITEKLPGPPGKREILRARVPDR